jgi:hypothetical protein
MVAAAAKMATAEAHGAIRLIAPLVEKRLRIEDADGAPKVIVLDEAGAPSAMTVAELVAEMRKDKALAQAFEPEVRPKANGAANGHAADASTMSASEILGAIRRGELPIKR